MENSIFSSFLEKSNHIHNNKYDYTKSVYKNTYSKIIITCSLHGDFLQTPKNHKNGHGCPKCSIIDRKSKLSNNLFFFIKKSNTIHGDRYDYSKSIYINNRTNLIVTCYKHGDFLITPSHHYIGHGCKHCTNNYRKTNSEFIEVCMSLHNGKYLYDLVDFTSNKRKIIITCPSHGNFSQIAGHHIIGHGCPICSSSIGEKYIKEFLDKNLIKYTKEKTFSGCESRNGKKLKFDFYLEDYNTCIEYDGIQHFEPIEFLGGKKAFEKLIVNDKIKDEFCKSNKIKLIRIKYLRHSNKNKETINKILFKKIK